MVPPWTVAVAATRPRTFPGGTSSGCRACCVLKQLDEGERHDKSALNDVLRDHGATL